MQIAELLRSLFGKLQRKGYAQIAGPPPLQLAMFKQASGFGDAKLVGVVANIDPPSVSFARVEPWFKQTMGRRGAGIVICAFDNAPPSYVAEVPNLGQGALGYGLVVGGVYDLSRNAYSLPQGFGGTVHLGWDQELFG